MCKQANSLVITFITLNLCKFVYLFLYVHTKEVMPYLNHIILREAFSKQDLVPIFGQGFTTCSASF